MSSFGVFPHEFQLRSKNSQLLLIGVGVFGGIFVNLSITEHQLNGKTKKMKVGGQAEMYCRGLDALEPFFVVHRLCEVKRIEPNNLLSCT
jgi:hypothetical protein